MPKGKRKLPPIQVRSAVARAAWESTGAGFHQKTHKQARSAERVRVKRGVYDD
jgi:hypothetical protein